MKITAFNPKIGFLEEKKLVASTDKPSLFLIGRHPNSDLVLNTPGVSRVHGLITSFQQNYYFVELASTSGSRLNNQEVLVNQNCILQPGDNLRIGDFFLLFLSEEEQIKKPEPYWFLKPQTTDNYHQINSGKQDELIVNCSQIVQETHDVKTFCFITSPPTMFNYQPGQFVTLELEIDGKLIKRPYSISSTPSRPHNLEITVKRVPAPNDIPDAPPGLVSNWLHDNFTVGNQIKISPPTGNFTIQNNPNRKFIFISAGSGITPMMSMSRWLCDTTPNADIVFIHSAKTVNDIAFCHELEFMANRHPNFQLAINLTGMQYNPNWLGYTGRLNETMIKTISHDFQERIVYVCGPDGFRENVKAILRELEFPMENYYEESFGSSKKQNKQQKQPQLVVADDTPTHFYSKSYAPIPQKSNVVAFTKSQKEVVCDAKETILQAAQKEGITLPYGCQMGACGQCKLRKLSGDVYYEEDFNCEEDYVLTCVAKADGNVVIEG
ncbi:MAG: FHA domain-containing protein [Rivularia sp. T60_A2020_040]|nr:FHA domain-containing protein [Rivularia sp. T60_A2020_040]